MRSEGSLTGKSALITGAGVGLGEGIAMKLAEQGAAVVLHYAFDHENAIRTAQQITQRGGRAHAVKGDLTMIEDCFRIVEEATSFLGGLDILVNNAGMTARAEFLDVTPAMFDQLFHLNMRGYFFCAQQAARSMVERGGSILNITSVHAFAGMPTYSVYASTKGAIVAFTRQLATELTPYRIRVNAIAPGHIEVARHLADPNYSHEAVVRSSPWGRVGQPDDVAHAAAFLVSDAAYLITGQVLAIDAGLTAKMAANPLPLPKTQPATAAQ
jgi:NAD(P)-dependent dehydrogenase (short-subunit alcohol dehydrogenase family)